MHEVLDKIGKASKYKMVVIHVTPMPDELSLLQTAAVFDGEQEQVMEKLMKDEIVLVGWDPITEKRDFLVSTVENFEAPTIMNFLNSYLSKLPGL